MLLILAGCYKTESIRSYSAPKESAPIAPVAEPAAAAAVPGEPTDRMIAAILPVAGQAYFFKVVGPIPEIAKHEKEINDFLASLRVGDDGKPKWQVPAGWKEEAASNMRMATLVIPADGKRLEVAISALPWAGNAESLLSNINRWRGQMQLPAIGESQLGENTRELKIGETPLTIVDLRGRSSGASMSPPFAGAAGGAAPRLPGASSTDLPAGHPPIDGDAPGGAPPPAAAPDMPKFAAPGDWKAEAGGGMRRAAFTIGDHSGLVTVSSFPVAEGSAIADPLQNLNMWRTAVGLPPATAEELAKFTEKMDIAGTPATYVRVVPEAPAAGQPQTGMATLAAMVTRGDQVWFFKLKGERAIVVAQEDAFKTFLKSVQFGAEPGSK